jgi:hypothetical protein
VIYPDLQFASSLIVKGQHTSLASTLFRELPAPLELSLIHRLQIENALLRLFHGSDAQQVSVARAGLQLWRQYLDEQVFVIRPFDLESGFAKAAAWNATYRTQPPRHGLLIHAAIAALERSTFLSFDPTLRKRAADEGLKLLPEKL